LHKKVFNGGKVFLEFEKFFTLRNGSFKNCLLKGFWESNGSSKESLQNPVLKDTFRAFYI